MLELIRFGAVHWCPVPPEQPGKEGVLQLQEISPAFAARQAALKVFGKYVRPKPLLLTCACVAGLLQAHPLTICAQMNWLIWLPVCTACLQVST